MENPIIKEIDRLTGGQFSYSAIKQAQIDGAKDPSRVADWLAGRVDSFRQQVAEYLGIDGSLITNAEIIEAVDLSRAKRSYAGSGRRLAELLGAQRCCELGRLSEASSGPVPVLYAHLLGREPDAAGLAFYQKCLRDGVPLWRVIQSIEESEEAKNA